MGSWNKSLFVRSGSHDQGRALEILKSESVQPMTMMSSMSPFPKKKNIISPVTKTNDNWQSYNSSTLLYDGNPGIMSMIKAGIINKYIQVYKNKERKKKDDFVVISTSAGFS